MRPPFLLVGLLALLLAAATFAAHAVVRSAVAPPPVTIWCPVPAPIMPVSPPKVGEVLYTKRACMQCHSLDGTVGVGPSLAGPWPRAVALADGSTTWADDDYLRESMLDPRAKLVAGYAGTMPDYTGVLRDRDVAALIAYLKSLDAPAPPPVAADSMDRP